MTDTKTFLIETVRDLRAEAAAFEASHTANLAGPPAITSTPFAIVDATLNLALDRSGKGYGTKPITPDLCDMVLFSRERAQSIVAQLNEDSTSWQVVSHRDLARLCAESLNNLADAIEQDLD